MFELFISGKRYTASILIMSYFVALRFISIVQKQLVIDLTSAWSILKIAREAFYTVTKITRRESRNYAAKFQGENFEKGKNLLKKKKMSDELRLQISSKSIFAERRKTLQNTTTQTQTGQIKHETSIYGGFIFCVFQAQKFD